MPINADYFTIGAPVGIPPTGQKVILCDTDGSFKSMDAAGTKAALGGGTALPSNIQRAASNVDKLDLTGFNSDTDGDYCIWGTILLPSTSPELDIVIEPGGSNTGQSGGFQASGAATFNAVSDLRVGGVVSSGGTDTFEFSGFLRNSKSGGDNRLWEWTTKRQDGVLYFGRCTMTDTSSFSFIRVNVRSGGVAQTGKVLTGSWAKCQALGYVAG